jgi:hypothetical protein
VRGLVGRNYWSGEVGGDSGSDNFVNILRLLSGDSYEEIYYRNSVLHTVS